MRGRDDDELPLSKTPPVDEDVRREIEFHLEQRAAELEGRGLAPAAAMAAARDAFGDRAGVEEACRAIEQRRRNTRRRARRLDDLRSDLALGLRLLRRSPSFTIAAVATLALGIGATSAVFSVVDQVLLRPLAFESPDRLVRIDETHAKGSANVAWPNFLDLQEQARSFSAMASYGVGPTTVLGADRPLRVNAAIVSRDFFKVFPVRPVVGRLPLPDEHRLGAPAVAVVSHAFWRDRLGAPPSLDGVRLRMGREVTVVGVLPPGFDFPREAQLWAPLELVEQSMSRTAHNWDVVGRLAGGTRPADAAREGSALMARLAREYPNDFDATGVIVTPLQDALTDSARTPLLLLLGASTFLLLAACTNLASAMLARGAARQVEVAMRTALGATRERLLRQLLTESAVLSLLGLAAGLGTAWGLLRAFSLFAPGALRQWDVQLDGRALAFSALGALCTTLVFGLLPAVRLSRGAPSKVLRGGTRELGQAGHSALWRSLVSAEVAFAAALLAGSALLIRSFGHVLEMRLGFEPEARVAATVTLPDANYPGSSRAADGFHRRLLERLQGAPEVASAGFVNVPPLGGDYINGSMEVEGKGAGKNGEANGYAVYRVVGGEYFEAAGIRLVRGRAFSATDDASAPPVVVVSAEFARREWGSEDPIGRRVRPAGQDGQDEPWHTVVGVVDDVRTGGRTAPFGQVYYFHHLQRPAHRSSAVTYIVRAARGGVPLEGVVRDGVTATDPNVPVETRPMASMVREAVADRAFMMFVLGAFAAIALVLAIVGIYAVVSYSVAQRTREIGVRVALGATPGAVRVLVLRSALAAVAPGLAVGAAIAVADARLLRAFVYGVTPLDPVTLGAAFGVLALCAMGSALIPTLRATRVSPMEAIRAE